MLKKSSIMKSAVTLSSRHTAAGLEGRNDRKTELQKKQVSKCTGRIFADVFYYLIFGLESIVQVLPYLH